MTIAIGSRLGRYEVRARLGVGGTAEVWRARDSSLGRDVAIKLLPPSVRTDSKRLRRLEREAELLATLNHPNVATVYGLERTDDDLLIVMELVDGESLAERLRRASMSVGEACRIARQIADALEAVHDRGLVHRDLKPGNIMLTGRGTVKVLDLGLARLERPFDRDEANVTSTTDTDGIKGTLPYMSPEQLDGIVDRRTDIWSFGCVLFECLAGTHPFKRATVAGTMAAVAAQEPDWDLLRDSVPPHLVRLLQRCLSKNVDDRLGTIGEARTILDSASTDASVRRFRWSRRVAGRRRAPILAAVAVLVTLIGTSVWLSEGQPPRDVGAPVTRFTVALPDGTPLIDGDARRFALSPDGAALVYVGEDGGQAHLFRRQLEDAEAHLIPGTAGGDAPFFSPDGQWIGFFADGTLMKIPLHGGSATRLADAPAPRGATWGSDGSIIFAPAVRSGLFVVSDRGGPAEMLTTLDLERGDVTHRWPELGPDGHVLIYTVGTREMSSFDDALVVARSMDDGRERTLALGTGPQFAGGDIVFARAKRLYSAPLDMASLDLLAGSRVVLDDVGVFQSSGKTLFDVSSSGTLAYLSYSSASQTALTRVDSLGEGTDLTDADRAYRSPRLSPDGERVAMAVVNPDGSSDVWIHDLARGVRSRLTFEGLNGRPVWSPDGRHVVFGTSQGVGPGTYNLFTAPADASGRPQRLRESTSPELPADWLPDGRLIYEALADSTGMDLWTLRVGSGLPPEPLIVTAFNESLARVSPDGRWIAWVSDESGRLEVYVRPLETAGPRARVSRDGGTEPIWSADGGRLYFRFGSRVYSVSLQLGSEISVGVPKLMFDAPFESGFGSWGYDLLGPAGPFIMIRSSRILHLRVTANWLTELATRPGSTRASTVNRVP